MKWNFISNSYYRYVEKQHTTEVIFNTLDLAIITRNRELFEREIYGGTVPYRFFNITIEYATSKFADYDMIMTLIRRGAKYNHISIFYLILRAIKNRNWEDIRFLLDHLENVERYSITLFGLNSEDLPSLLSELITSKCFPLYKKNLVMAILTEFGVYNLELIRNYIELTEEELDSIFSELVEGEVE